MAMVLALNVGACRYPAAAGLVLLWQAAALATDWPQYRGPNTDGTSPDPIVAQWPAGGPTVVWTNRTLTNGFSSFAVSQGRAFALMSRRIGSGPLREYCVAVDAATGTNIWATPIDNAPWDPAYTGDGGSGTAPYNRGDGPRTTPSVENGRVFALSGLMHLVCLNFTNGSVLWSNNLPSAYGASTIGWENAASPCLDDDLLFINLNSSPDNRNLAAFRTTDGGLAWSTQNEKVTHTTPVVATIEGMRQVIFAAQTGLVALNRTNGNFLWKFTYPFYPISTSMGASPVVYSNLIYCTAAYGRGAVGVRVTLNNGTWSATQLWYKNNAAGLPYRSIWMTPVCFQGYIYALAGENSTFLTAPLNCIELSTGNLMWTTNGFGMGGLILVQTNLVILTETGQLVLAQADPSAYTELARYQLFHFSASAPGKCWNSPAFSNGRLYAHSTREGMAVDLSVAPPPPLKLLSPQVLGGNQLQLTVSTADGTRLDANRLARIEVRATNQLGASPLTWPKLTNPLALTTNGQARLTNTISGDRPGRFFITVEPP